ncbi:HlyD family secretion protein [Piscinibacter terrae]|nr:HlyD family efflux transporter periplasmic adaptor subunit [Albitalea terrae]
MKPSPRTVVALTVMTLVACTHKEPAGWSGYVEGDYVYVSSPVGGTLQSLAVRRGQAVDAGAPLFLLESGSETAAREEAAARLAGAQAQAANATKGRRPDEIAVTEAQLKQAQAEAQRASTELTRQQQLLSQGFISQSRLDDARTAVTEANQRVSELNAALRVARLPAREDERAAATASAEAARHSLKQSEWRTQQKQQAAPAKAQVADTFFRVGEWVPPGQPVLSLLPPASTKARFFVPESEIASLAVGQAVSLSCDGCPSRINARIEFIATQPEYTPPIIYSNSQRSRLVFMVEARPQGDEGAKLKPGQPIDVQRTRS